MRLNESLITLFYLSGSHTASGSFTKSNLKSSGTILDLTNAKYLINYGRCLEGGVMFEALIIILLVLWLLGVVTSTAGSFIHFLLVVALVMFVVRLFSGRKAFWLSGKLFENCPLVFLILIFKLSDLDSSFERGLFGFRVICNQYNGFYPEHLIFGR